jgi:hypothetical protein
MINPKARSRLTQASRAVPRAFRRRLRLPRRLRVGDSDPLHAAVMRLLPRWTCYDLVRPVVHLLYRASVVGLPFGPASAVVVHLPATSTGLRRV